MKIKEEFVVREFAGSYIAVSLNDSNDKSKHFITLNKSGAYVWDLLKNDTTYDKIIEAMIDKYHIDISVAKNDLDLFLNKLNEADLLIE